jgi:hypothetical protein
MIILNGLIHLPGPDVYIQYNYIMTYLDKKSLINDSYSRFTSDFINQEIINADEEYPFREDCFVKCIYKVLLNHQGDSNYDLLSKEQIQDCIILFNKYSHSTVSIEYDEA